MSRFVDSIRLASKMGGLVGHQGHRVVHPYGDRPWHVVTGRQDVAAVWALRDEEMKSHLVAMRPAIGRNLLTTHGPDHTRRRHGLQPPFRTAELTRVNAPTAIADIARHHFTTSTATRFRDIAGPLVLDVTLATLRLDPKPDPAAVYDWIRYLDRAFVWLMFKKRFSQDPIPLGTRTPMCPDDWPDQDVHDEILGIISAGDTTSVAMTWAVHEAIRRPAVLECLASGDDQYLDAFIKETLRFHTPPAIIARMVTVPLYLPDSELTIPAGEKVAVDPHGVHRDPARYERPNEFIPDRWMYEMPGFTPVTDFVPFSAGVRRCVGQHLAEMTMKIALKIYFTEFTPVKTTSAAPEEKVRRIGALAPKEGVKIS